MRLSSFHLKTLTINHEHSQKVKRKIRRYANGFIQLFQEQPEWMSSLPDFKPFNFKGRRFMLPAEIDGKELEFVIFNSPIDK